MSSMEPQARATRKAIPRRLRFEILKRDNHTCRYCHAADTPLTIDHVTPVALGGTDDPGNLVAACKDCNAGKASSSPGAATVAQVADDTVRWSTAMQAAAERMAANKAAVDEQLKPWFDEWFVSSGPGWSYKLPSDADAVLTKYLAAGMPLAVLIDAARVALNARQINERFRYFQGVANNMLAELQRDAAAILSAPEEPADYECGACHYRHARNECGFRTGWRIGYVDCSLMQTDTTDPSIGHPDHYLAMALSRVVDAAAHQEWADRSEELYPLYTGRVGV